MSGEPLDDRKGLCKICGHDRLIDGHCPYEELARVENRRARDAQDTAAAVDLMLRI